MQQLREEGRGPALQLSHPLPHPEQTLRLLPQHEVLLCRCQLLSDIVMSLAALVLWHGRCLRCLQVQVVIAAMVLMVVDN